MGLGIASVSYDSSALLRNFAERKDLHYPMLSDPESRMIRAFDILNDNFPKDNQWYGVPFPGMYIIDERGIVKAKYFEDDHRERYLLQYSGPPVRPGWRPRTTVDAPTSFTQAPATCGPEPGRHADSRYRPETRNARVRARRRGRLYPRIEDAGSKA
jgi:hypothetical protein